VSNTTDVVTDEIEIWRNRPVDEVYCCDGLTGLPDAIASVFPDAVVQTCVMHVIRNAMRFVSYRDREKVVKSMRAIYTAPTLEAAEHALKTNRAFGGPTSRPRQWPSGGS
jgi:transposase-like protein